MTRISSPALALTAVLLMAAVAFCQDLRDRNAPQGGGSRFQSNANARIAPPVVGGSRSGYTLGVYVDNTETGVVITNVTANSAAARARLERGDRIVTVNGYQVGIVGGRTYTLDDEYFRADRFGRVQLLVLDHRTGQLAVVSVQLDPAGATPAPSNFPQNPSFPNPSFPGFPGVVPGLPGSGSSPIIPGLPSGIYSGAVRGSVTYRARVALPPNAVVSVSLIDYSDESGRPRTINQQQIAAAGRQVPIPFELTYSPTGINPLHTYGVTAEISVDGRTRYRTASPSYVLTRGNPREVQLVVDAAR